MLAISLSEDEFKFLRLKNKDEKCIAIRIYSHADEVMHLSKTFDAQFEDVLFTYFTDINKEIEDDGKIYKPFSVDNYNEIVEFIAKYNYCDKVYIHCSMGIQRSAGVVVGLSNQYDWIDCQHGLDGNSPVYPYGNVVSWFN